MTCTVFGRAFDRWGHALFVEHVQQGDAAVPVTRVSACPSASLRSVQPSPIEIDFGHSGRPVGAVVHIERDADQRTWIVGVIDDADVDDLDDSGPWFWSPEIAGRRAPGSAVFEDVVIEGVALVHNPAGIALPAVKYLDGDIRQGADYCWPANLVPSFLRSAISSCREYRSADAPLFITGPRDDSAIERLDGGMTLVDGAPLVSRTSTFKPVMSSQPETVPVRVARIDNADHFVIDTPPTGRSPRRRTKLLWQGQPVGHLVGDVGHGGLMFQATRTTAGREALALCADQVVDGAMPRRLAGGEWSSLVLTVT